MAFASFFMLPWLLAGHTDIAHGPLEEVLAKLGELLVGLAVVVALELLPGDAQDPPAASRCRLAPSQQCPRPRS